MRRSLIILIGLVVLVPATGYAALIPAGTLNFKNNTATTVACTLLSEGSAIDRVRLRPGRSYSREFVFGTSPPSLACPAIRPAPYDSLAFGRRYVFLRIRGRIELTEVTTNISAGQPD